MSARSESAGATGASRIRVPLRAAILVVLVSVLAVAAVYPTRLYLQQRVRITDLAQQTRLLERQNAQLQAETNKLRDPAYLEWLARSCLGMVKRGETAFIIVPKNGEPRPSSCSPGAESASVGS